MTDRSDGARMSSLQSADGPAAVQALSVHDRGLHYGDGLFETIVCLRGQPRFLRDHLQRLSESCARLAIAAPAADELSARILEAGRGGDCIVKLIVTRGEAKERGYRIDPALCPTTLVLRHPLNRPDPAAIQSGVRARLGKLRLAESEQLAGMKHLNRLEQVLARAEWSDPAIGESLLGSRSGELISGTMSNVFIVRQGALETPALERAGVRGVMRAVVLRTARAAGLAAHERAIGWSELPGVREAFLTNSVMGVCPIRELDGRALEVGETTRRVQQLMGPLLAGDAGDARLALPAGDPLLASGARPPGAGGG